MEARYGPYLLLAGLAAVLCSAVAIRRKPLELIELADKEQKKRQKNGTKKEKLVDLQEDQGNQKKVLTHEGVEFLFKEYISKTEEKNGKKRGLRRNQPDSMILA